MRTDVTHEAHYRGWRINQARGGVVIGAVDALIDLIEFCQNRPAYQRWQLQHLRIVLGSATFSMFLRIWRASFKPGFMFCVWFRELDDDKSGYHFHLAVATNGNQVTPKKAKAVIVRLQKLGVIATYEPPKPDLSKVTNKALADELRPIWDSDVVTYGGKAARLDTHGGRALAAWWLSYAAKARTKERGTMPKGHTRRFGACRLPAQPPAPKTPPRAI